MAVEGQSCSNCKNVWEYQPQGDPLPPEMYSCHCDTPKWWHNVLPSDWCGKWEAIPVVQQKTES